MPEPKNADTRTEAQKALGIHPTKAEDKEEGTEAERDNTAESEEDEDESEESSESPEEADKEDEEAEQESEPDDKEDSKEEDSEDTVPLALHLADKKIIKQLTERIGILEKKYGEEAEKELVGQMATELNITADQASKLLDFSTKSILAKLEREGRIITPELKKKIDAFQEGSEELDETKTKQREETRQINYFNDEWQDFLPGLKKQYKNASPSMLKEAAQQMYQLARSRSYGNVPNEHPAYPLDYIFFKEKKTFDTLLRVAQGRSGEAGHDIAASEDGEKPDFTDPNMTPQKYQRWKAHQNAEKMARDRASGSVKFR